MKPRQHVPQEAGKSIYICSVVGFMPPLQRGGFSCTGPTAVDRDKSTGLMLIMEYLFAGPGYGPQRLSDISSKGSTRTNM